MNNKFNENVKSIIEAVDNYFASEDVQEVVTGVEPCVFVAVDTKKSIPNNCPVLKLADVFNGNGDLCSVHEYRLYLPTIEGNSLNNYYVSLYGLYEALKSKFKYSSIHFEKKYIGICIFDVRSYEDEQLELGYERDGAWINVLPKAGGYKCKIEVFNLEGFERSALGDIMLLGERSRKIRFTISGPRCIDLLSFDDQQVLKLKTGFRVYANDFSEYAMRETALPLDLGQSYRLQVKVISKSFEFNADEFGRGNCTWVLEEL